MFKWLLSLLLISGVGYADTEKEQKAGAFSFGVIVNKYPGLSMKFNLLPNFQIQGQLAGVNDKFTYTTLDYIINLDGIYTGLGFSYYIDEEERTTIKWTGKRFETVELERKNIRIMRIPIGMNKIIDEHTEIFGEFGANIYAFEGDITTPFDSAIGMRFRF